MADQELTPQQRAATVIVALGTDKASRIYQYMGPDELEQLTLEVAKLGHVPTERTEQVLEEFYQMCLTNKAVTEGGMEYARSVLQKAFGDQAADQLLSKVTKALTNRAFSFLDKTDAKTLLSTLQHERAQTIALVLSYVDPDKAAAVIEELPANKKLRVVENIARMESASPGAVKMLEEELKKKFANIIVAEKVQVGGLDQIAAIMNNLERSSEKAVFDGLEKRNGKLAEEIRKRMFVFEDIVKMDDRSVQRFVRDCDTRDIVLALKGANREVAEKLFANMSSRMRQNIEEDLEITTNVRIRDVEEAQQRIVGIIRDLEERNEIIILKGGKDEIIA
ncbi:flagellar motor switch protein FliG [Agathobaculum sp. NSJ-28]|uniref:Flagellar motor switch protein FliG n=2 Tax=Agathobaculum TaxID=2048137 RepID=A0A923RVJ1_9FIRM|nr:MULTISPECIES: flagellar motor switch protein FliG [Butyricicoccaceae]MBS6883436.1 flagellar motor switch protein FliG [Clostridiaceae bacterium]SCJ35063.1 Flagellar motor switch protein FliG [uncultured Butyricicoccus sp.]MBC5725082.1 flagellar motor switch protein FliG [Agathobaculum faecis]MCU6789735.1 flagellar motor switch protein FliG [Agathobaculum ammoniilyticum]WOC74540.1 flagellar motor switch protein FliG [Intestinibacillus sp. NTUH-41-i26]